MGWSSEEEINTHTLLFKNTLVGKGRIERRWWPEAAGSAEEDNVREEKQTHQRKGEGDGKRR